MSPAERPSQSSEFALAIPEISAWASPPFQNYPCPFLEELTTFSWVLVLSEDTSRFFQGFPDPDALRDHQSSLVEKKTEKDTLAVFE